MIYRRIIAERVAAQLMAAKLPKIGIDEVRAALRADPDFGSYDGSARLLEEATLRHIIKAVG